MPIKTTCPTCGQVYTLADNLQGKHVRCKHCSETFEVVSRSAAGTPAPQKATIPGRGSDSGGRGKPPSVPSHRRGTRDEEEALDVLPAEDDGFDDVDAGPRYRGGRRRKGMPLWAWLTIGGGGVFLLIVIVVVVLAATGTFGSKVTMENFKKINRGMSESEVRDILGAPDDRNMSAPFGPQIVSWKDGDNEIQVIFVNNKVRGMSARFKDASVFDE